MLSNSKYQEINCPVYQESPKIDTPRQNMGFLVSLLNFFGMFGENYVDYETGERTSRIDALTVPAEMTMGLIGLYGLYFATVGFDLSNRRKKRSIQGNNLCPRFIVYYIIASIVMMKSCLIFVTLFFVYSLIEESMGCKCIPILWPCPINTERL